MLITSRVHMDEVHILQAIFSELRILGRQPLPIFSLDLVSSCPKEVPFSLTVSLPPGYPLSQVPEISVSCICMTREESVRFTTSLGTFVAKGKGKKREKGLGLEDALSSRHFLFRSAYPI